ncbi:HNH endonuclease [Hyphomicrobium sp. MC1]|uniref:HNH endonuclease signature motif containing protein n=1 Tax=Hyphomicrobium sp. (strain MC1) TaxID=717785 RepID=UPI000213EB25|nr:HNH endonuclease [Hyphomicrobium sp. MC1]CCB65392.1 HNH endonuclease [Hyphomicrobium sp. MC1]
MPVKPPYIASCGCIIHDGKPCVHQRKRAAERKSRFDTKRPSAAARGYDGKWQKARAAYLKAHPICARCNEPATVVDHIVAHKGSEFLFWHQANWMQLCQHHHNSWKQSQEKRRA